MRLSTSASRRDDDVRALYTHMHKSSSVGKIKERGLLADTFGSGKISKEIKSTKEPEERKGVATKVLEGLHDEQEVVQTRHYTKGAYSSEEHNELLIVTPGATEGEKAMKNLSLLDNEGITMVVGTHDVSELSSTSLVLPTKEFDAFLEEQE